VDDGRFGLASEGLSEVLSLSAEQVRWRSTHSKRPWLSGTVIDQMCAILDVDRLCAQLLEGLEAVAEDE
jgi:purine-binding chemotaxis protein CheW